MHAIKLFTNIAVGNLVMFFVKHFFTLYVYSKTNTCLLLKPFFIAAAAAVHFVHIQGDADNTESTLIPDE